MTYDPRKYWKDRLEKEGKLYVSTKNNAGVNDKQLNIFKEALLGIAPDGIGYILDFGCGVGRFAETALKFSSFYIGADINEGAFQHAPLLENAKFIHLKEDRIPFSDGFFDAAMSVTVLQHIVDPAQYDIWSSELQRVVKPGGVFLIIDDANTKAKMSPHMKVRGPETIAASLGATIEIDGGIISAERPNSHYVFTARK